MTHKLIIANEKDDLTSGMNDFFLGSVAILSYGVVFLSDIRKHPKKYSILFFVIYSIVKQTEPHVKHGVNQLPNQETIHFAWSIVHTFWSLSSRAISK